MNFFIICCNLGELFQQPVLSGPFMPGQKPSGPLPSPSPISPPDAEARRNQYQKQNPVFLSRTLTFGPAEEEVHDGAGNGMQKEGNGRPDTPKSTSPPETLQTLPDLEPQEPIPSTPEHVKAWLSQPAPTCPQVLPSQPAPAPSGVLPSPSGPVRQELPVGPAQVLPTQPGGPQPSQVLSSQPGGAGGNGQSSQGSTSIYDGGMYWKLLGYISNLHYVGSMTG